MEFLTKEELKELTGYKQSSKQIECLKKLHYPVQGVNRFGMPLVIYKDVFGFRRDGVTNHSANKNKSNWQPPPQ